MLQPKSLPFLVIVAIAAVVFLPVYILTYLYPSIDKLLIQDAENHARNVASHFPFIWMQPGNIFATGILPRN
ncbi:MAG TPA: hypothetical protein ENN06_02135 [Desulfobacteraceae bacterium]|nr:hypothetical protein [Desulfobacteraceae bacterium]